MLSVIIYGKMKLLLKPKFHLFRKKKRISPFSAILQHLVGDKISEYRNTNIKQPSLI